MKTLIAGLSLLMLIACGKQEEKKIPPAPIVEPSGPSGAAWDALAWIPALDRVEVAIFDYGTIRGDRHRWRGKRSWNCLDNLWRDLVGRIRVPEGKLQQIIYFRNPAELGSDIYICNVSLPADEIAKLLKERGYGETAELGARVWRSLPPEDPKIPAVDTGIRFAWLNDRLVLRVFGNEGVDKLLDRVLRVRQGKEPSLQTVPRMAELIKSVSQGLPVEIERGMEGKEAPQAVVTSYGADSKKVEGVALFSSEAAATKSLQTLNGRSAAFADLQLRVDGALIKISYQEKPDAQTLRRHAEMDLENLQRVVTEYEMDQGRSPTPEEGLKALTGTNRSGSSYLEGFLGDVPLDPWGNAYVYQPNAKDRLRSAGPDGKPGTDDDILPR